LQPNKVVSAADIYKIFGGPETDQSVECFVHREVKWLGRKGLGAAHVWQAIQVFWRLTPESPVLPKIWSGQPPEVRSLLEHMFSRDIWEPLTKGSKTALESLESGVEKVKDSIVQEYVDEMDRRMKRLLPDTPAD
jgi:hypothetical protein